MASVLLVKPDIALFADPGPSRVVVPHLVAAPRTRRREKVPVRFEGFDAPVSFRGEARTRSYTLTCRYVHDEHAQMKALIDLLESAEDAPDDRLQLRTSFFATSTFAGLDLYEVVVAGDVTETHLGGRAWDVSFVVNTVDYTLEV